MIFKKILKNKTFLIILLLLVLIIPTFWRMLRPGIFSMHDFHVFRLYEYDKCIADLQIPCRWAQDATFEYGQPVFNYYAQAPYAFGEVFILLGLSVLDSIKALFVASLVVSALTMFLLSKQLWKNNFAALASSLVYTYAPYRAVDIFVRGALPEALAFIFFPLVIYFFNDYVFKKRLSSLLFFGLSYGALILTHNLSALMFLIILAIWAIFILTQNRAWNLLPKFVLVGFLTFGLTAFYILPVVVENNLISVGQTTQGYYDFSVHFTTLKQLLISRYWGYGASLWGDDDRLSLSVGQVQWILPILILILITARRKFKGAAPFFVFFALGWIALFLTHNKSTFIWTTLPAMAYIQFPWRFLGSAVFAFAVSVGALYILAVKDMVRVVSLAVVAAILIALNTGFFFEDLWFKFSDKDQFSGSTYIWQVSSAHIYDFWPKTAKVLPIGLAPSDPIVTAGSGSGKLIEKRSNKATYDINIQSENATLQIPIVYFPGWTAFVESKKVNLYPSDDLGLITLRLDKGQKQIKLKFENTTIRTVGNTISALSLFSFMLLLILAKSRKNE